ncbi:MAG: ATP-binding protein [Woeseiaceae bacterium]|nr:ATP-binding protein [Woeseiaceae bacterium]
MNIDKKGQLYIGRKSEGGEPVLLKASTLTTHGVIFGMTGSGKTGLGVNMLEEALLGGTPTLILDPKGDMGNILLNFPDSTADDLEPWMDKGKARRKGVTVRDLAVKESAERQADLAGDGITPERIARLRDNTKFKIYTPGSSIGIPINILGSLKAPELDWRESAETIRDEIEGIVSSILVLADIKSDPVSGPDHILISTIIETWWRQGKDLDLATLVGQIPKPPFRKLGVFDLEMFFPEKDRMKLALKLNSLLASPSMASWLEGEPLDIESLLGTGGKTPCAVIYMAHLNEQERQFVVTLLLSKVVTWMRSKPGTSELSALIYMDEAFGYAPPSAEPPSKKPILTILKQARAFGVGLVLVTQNPVDLDYKAMSNAGTWIVGRLQTDNDKRRILDGISGGMPDLDATISNLAKRQFVMHLAKKNRQTILSRRHSMCFRFGPFTRKQVASLMAPYRSEPAPAPEATQPAASVEVAAANAPAAIAPSVAAGIEVAYLDAAAPWAADLGADPTGTVLAPAAAVTVQLLYDETRAKVNHNETYEAVIFPLDGLIDVEDVLSVDHDDRDFKPEAPAGASYELGNTKLQNKTFWTRLRSDIKNHLAANRNIEIWKCPGLKLYSRVDEGEDAFRARCEQAADQAADAKVSQLRDRFANRIDRLQDQISTADARVAELEVDASARTRAEVMSGVGDLLGGLLKGRMSSRTLSQAATRRAASKKAKLRLATAKQKADAKRQDLIDLERDLEDELINIQNEFDALAENIEPLQIGLEKTDIRVAEAKLVWVPVA